MQFYIKKNQDTVDVRFLYSSNCRSKMTVAQLKACAASKDLKIPSKLTKKADILAFLKHYDSVSVKQLREMAKAKGIKVPSKYTKNLIYPLLF